MNTVMHDNQWLFDTVDMQWLKYRKQLGKCRQNSDEKSIHKLRISIRRLLSLIELLQALTADQYLRKLKKSLKTQLNAFNDLRDTQVMLQTVSAEVFSLPELTPFLHQLHLNTQKLLMDTPAMIKTLDSEKLQQNFKPALQKLKKTYSDSDLKPAVLHAIDSHYQTTLARYQCIDPSQPATLHHLRVSLKKFRYMLSCIAEMLPELPTDHLKHIQTYLTHLGEIQNTCVLLNNLQCFFNSSIPPTVLSHYHQHQKELIQTYLTQSADIGLFWRPTTSQPFPW